MNIKRMLDNGLINTALNLDGSKYIILKKVPNAKNAMRSNLLAPDFWLNYC